MTNATMVSRRFHPGEAIYSAIFEAAPSLQNLFKTPRAVMVLGLQRYEPARLWSEVIFMASHVGGQNMWNVLSYSRMVLKTGLDHGW